MRPSGGLRQVVPDDERIALRPMADRRRELVRSRARDQATTGAGREEEGAPQEGSVAVKTSSRRPRSITVWRRSVQTGCTTPFPAARPS